MPRTTVVIYQESDGSAPLLDWLGGLPEKTQDKCIARIELLGERGFELRRPACDYLNDAMKKPRSTTDAVAILHQRYITGHPARLKSLQMEREKLCIAEQVYDLRIQAGLTQKQLAHKVGTTQSAISRLEDADYEGHSLDMLRRIAAALHQRVEIRFVPEDAHRARL